MLEIVVREVIKTFESQRGTRTLALDGVNLQVKPGEIACIIGPSGCGKTTLLNLVAGFDFPTSGEVLVGGKQVEGAGVDRVVIFQDVQGSLMPWLNTIQNVEFGLRMSKMPHEKRTETARRYLKLVGLTEAEDKFPSELSGGMQQRVQIARALVLDPDVLLMDEPFGALDFLTRTRLQILLQQLHSKSPTTILFVTHDIGEAVLLGDSIWVMNKEGKIVERQEIPFSRPRRLSDQRVVTLVEYLEKLILAPAADPSEADISPIETHINPDFTEVPQ